MVEFFFDVCDRNRNGFIGKNEVELMMDMNDGINASDTRLHSELSDAVKEELLVCSFEALNIMYEYF